MQNWLLGSRKQEIDLYCTVLQQKRGEVFCLRFSDTSFHMYLHIFSMATVEKCVLTLEASLKTFILRTKRQFKQTFQVKNKSLKMKTKNTPTYKKC